MTTPAQFKADRLAALREMRARLVRYHGTHHERTQTVFLCWTMDPSRNFMSIESWIGAAGRWGSLHAPKAARDWIAVRIRRAVRCSGGLAALRLPDPLSEYVDYTAGGRDLPLEKYRRPAFAAAMRLGLLEALIAEVEGEEV